MSSYTRLVGVGYTEDDGDSYIQNEEDIDSGSTRRLILTNADGDVVTLTRQTLLQLIE